MGNIRLKFERRVAEYLFLSTNEYVYENALSEYLK